ncbi:AAA-associated domain-containing protein [Paenibacillus rhizoplanae]
MGQQVDLYKLADQLSLKLEDFLPIVEAVEMLQFATILQGDIELTEVGHQFADASVLLRKEIFQDPGAGACSDHGQKSSGFCNQNPITRWNGPFFRGDF